MTAEHLIPNDMDVKKELELLESKFNSGLTEEVSAFAAKIKNNATSVEDKAIIEEFIAKNLKVVERDIDEMEYTLLRM